MRPLADENFHRAIVRGLLRQLAGDHSQAAHAPHGGQRSTSHDLGLVAQGTLSVELYQVEECMALVLPEPTPTEEVLDFLLSAPTPEAVIALQPSPAAQERLRYLLDGNRNTTLNDAERAELESYMQLEHFVRRLKLRAREKLAAGA